MKSLKSRLTEDKLLGIFVDIPGMENAEILAAAGFDWLLFDLEHSMIDLRDLLAMIAAAQNLGAAPLVRVPQIDPGLCKRVLDAGAQGVMFPMVADARQARQCVQSVKYPPKGVRGVGPGRAQGYGAKLDEYVRSANDNVCVILQIETAEGLDNLDEIIAVPDVDIIFIGTADLKKSLGLQQDQELEEHVQKIKRRCLKNNVAVGTIVFDADRALERFTEGFAFIAVSLDCLIYLNAAKQIVADARSSNHKP